MPRIWLLNGDDFPLAGLAGRNWSQVGQVRLYRPPLTLLLGSHITTNANLVTRKFIKSSIIKDIIFDFKPDYTRLSLYPMVESSTDPSKSSDIDVAVASIRPVLAPGIMSHRSQVNSYNLELDNTQGNECDYTEDYRSGTIVDVIGGLFALLQALHLLLFGRPLLWGLTGAKLITPFGLLGEGVPELRGADQEGGTSYFVEDQDSTSSNSLLTMEALQVDRSNPLLQQTSSTKLTMPPAMAIQTSPESSKESSPLETNGNEVSESILQISCPQVSQDVSEYGSVCMTVQTSRHIDDHTFELSCRPSKPQIVVNMIPSTCNGYLINQLVTPQYDLLEVLGEISGPTTYRSFLLDCSQDTPLLGKHSLRSVNKPDYEQRFGPPQQAYGAEPLSLASTALPMTSIAWRHSSNQHTAHRSSRQINRPIPISQQFGMDAFRDPSSLMEDPSPISLGQAGSQLCHMDNLRAIDMHTCRCPINSHTVQLGHRRADCAGDAPYFGDQTKYIFCSPLQIIVISLFNRGISVVIQLDRRSHESYDWASQLTIPRGFFGIPLLPPQFRVVSRLVATIAVHPPQIDNPTIKANEEESGDPELDPSQTKMFGPWEIGGCINRAREGRLANIRPTLSALPSGDAHMT
ncbi:unnamed protein product [Rhizoctonia solani]|uniref:Uncharacterized protein n=2 Tax=Rhizoctonia solani TaxID=456999 RepID=A0A8H3DHZ1_9AGAM|nr:unnamed protein product [Rhizoctonia solani]